LGINHIIRQLRHSARFAVALWLVLAFVVWNVVFDRILVLAGRRYSYAAIMAVRGGHAYLRIDDWMRPAIAQGVLIAVAIAKRLQKGSGADVEVSTTDRDRRA
jgi:hypothetical protein